jgi:endonuclease/exonuclease/phosphatase family metal-dependent hydrolase
MTWNIWWRFGPRWQDRQHGLVEALRAMDADVVALQEVWGKAETTQAHEFAGQLGLHAAFGAPSYVPAVAAVGCDRGSVGSGWYSLSGLGGDQSDVDNGVLAVHHLDHGAFGGDAVVGRAVTTTSESVASSPVLGVV